MAVKKVVLFVTSLVFSQVLFCTAAFACHVDPVSICQDGDQYLAWRICNNESQDHGIVDYLIVGTNEGGTISLDAGQCKEVLTRVQPGTNQLAARVRNYSWRYAYAIDWSEIKDDCGVCEGRNQDKGCDGVCFSDKEEDECGVCGGEGPGECGCDLSIIKDECGICGGNGPGECGCDLSIVKDECGVCGGDGPGECGCDLSIVKDECGVCGGDGPGECGCDRSIVKDQCGVCGGSGPGECGCDLSIVKDECGVCGGNNEDKGCDGVCFSDKEEDDCGICGGDNEDKGCDGVCFSEKVVDECGVCGGNDKDKGCDGVCFSDKVIDECGVCDGPGLNDSGCCGDEQDLGCGCGEPEPSGCDLQCGSEKVVDDCGVCGGKNEDMGCDGVCGSGAEFDECGVCGGDGSTCGNDYDCVEEAATRKERRKSRAVIKASKVIQERVKKFSNLAEECRGESLKKWRTQSVRLVKKVKKILSENITNTVFICSDSVCSTVKTGKVKRSLRRISSKLYRLAKDSKLQYLSRCQIQHSGGGSSSKVTEDYRDDLLQAIKKLPKKNTKC